MSQRPSDHPGWAEALANIETDASRAFVQSRAKDMDVRSLRTMTQDETIASTFPIWKRDIWVAELRRRPAEAVDYADGRAA